MSSYASKRLYRSRDGMVIGGVCSGLSKYSGGDAGLIRILWILSVLVGGLGVIAYLIAWIIIPEEPLDYKSETPVINGIEPRQILGIILVVIAFFLLAGKFHFSGFLHGVFNWVWPGLIILIGILVLSKPSVRSHYTGRREKDDPTYGSGPAGADQGSTANRASAEAASYSETVKKSNYSQQQIDGTVDSDKTESKENADASAEASKDNPDQDFYSFTSKSDDFDDDEPKRLKRSRKDSMLFGICGGIAEYYHADSSLVRLAFAVSTIMLSGVPLIVYLVMAVIIPEDDG